MTGGMEFKLNYKQRSSGIDKKYCNAVCVDVYDNSSGHNCKAKDALELP